MVAGERLARRARAVANTATLLDSGLMTEAKELNAAELAGREICEHGIGQLRRLGRRD
jgi:hypothetical protein